MCVQQATLVAGFETGLRIFAFECARCCEHQGLHAKQDSVELYMCSQAAMLATCFDDACAHLLSKAQKGDVSTKARV